MGIGIVGATLIAAGVGGAASLYASSTQASAAKNALALQTGAYNTAQTQLGPYRNLGESALGSIAGLYGFKNPVTGAAGTGTPDFSAFTNSPDYLFAQQQGQLGVERGAAARGLLQSGGTLKDLVSFNQGLAAQQYGNYFNRIMQTAQLGQTGATASANAAQNFGQTAGATTQNIGQAQASGPVGVANALSTLPQNLLYAQYFSGQGANPSSYFSPTSNSTTAAPNPGTGSMAYGNVFGNTYPPQG